MRFAAIIARFFGGFFFINAVPHITSGVAGHRFQSPFATPPGVGLSSPEVNAAWGVANLIIAYLLIYKTGAFDLRQSSHAAALLAGILAGALFMAHYFGALNAGA